MQPLVSIVIVCMDRMDLLRPCLDSIRKNTSVTYETFVVAYMFSEANLAALKAEYPWVTVVESRELRGFAENNNLALEKVCGKYTFIVNDDTFFDTPVIDSLVADFGRLPEDAAVVSPNILFPDGKVQTCGRRKMNAWTYMAHYLHRFNETKKTRHTMQEGLFKTYNLNGAAFLAKTELFSRLGWFDERYTFTPEDIALGTMFNEYGYGVYADADVKIYHIANSTASRMETAIKPTRVRGALIFYSRNFMPMYLFLGIYVWLVEACRGIKYLFKDCSDPDGHNAIMAATARNVRHSIFTGKTTKEIFTEYYNQLKG